MQTNHLLKRLAVLSTAVFMMMISGCQSELVGPTAPPAPPGNPPKLDTPYFKANAGPDIKVYIPDTDTVLDASASLDTGRVVSSYTWRQISGPSATLGVPNGFKARVTGMKEGVYSFELKAYSNKYGTSSLDTVAITVVDAFALGIAPRISIMCDTMYMADDQTVYRLFFSAYVDSANRRLDIVDGLSINQISGPNTASATIFSGNSSTYALLGNLVRGTYAFRIGVERRGIKTYDTTVLRLVQDTSRGKEYIYETTWKLEPMLGGSANDKVTVAEVTGVRGLLLGLPGRKITIFTADENSTTWKEWTTDWMMNEYASWNECGDLLGVYKMYADAAVVGKKVRIRIVIVN